MKQLRATSLSANQLLHRTLDPAARLRPQPGTGLKRR